MSDELAGLQGLRDRLWPADWFKVISLPPPSRYDYRGRLQRRIGSQRFWWMNSDQVAGEIAVAE